MKRIQDRASLQACAEIPEPESVEWPADPARERHHLEAFTHLAGQQQRRRGLPVRGAIAFRGGVDQPCEFRVDARLQEEVRLRREARGIEAGRARRIRKRGEVDPGGQVLRARHLLNTAYRVRGEAIFTDLIEDRARAHRVYEVVTTTMIEGARVLYAHQRRHGFEVRFLSVANCMLNMISPAQSREHLLPYDLRIRAAFEVFGIHNCAWSIDPHMEAYAVIGDLAYIDMGIESDLRRARRLFPRARRNLLYTPMDLKNKPWADLRADLDRIAEELGPCDLGLPDIEADVPDERIRTVLDYCRELSAQYEKRERAG